MVVKIQKNIEKKSDAPRVIADVLDNQPLYKGLVDYTEQGLVTIVKNNTIELYEVKELNYASPGSFLVTDADLVLVK